MSNSKQLLKETTSYSTELLLRYRTGLAVSAPKSHNQYTLARIEGFLASRLWKRLMCPITLLRGCSRHHCNNRESDMHARAKQRLQRVFPLTTSALRMSPSGQHTLRLNLDLPSQTKVLQTGAIQSSPMNLASLNTRVAQMRNPKVLVISNSSWYSKSIGTVRKLWNIKDLVIAPFPAKSSTRCNRGSPITTCRTRQRICSINSGTPCKNISQKTESFTSAGSTSPMS